ncbi:MAG: flagellar type III secretion system pore protein FliP [Lachnospirales bacterium]
MRKKFKKFNTFVFPIFLTVFFLLFKSVTVSASISIDLGTESSLDPTLQILFLTTLITLFPSILMMLTCFTRIIISMHFLRSALGTQQMPPNQILIGIALFLTIFLMGPTFTEINENAIKPLSSGEITQEEFLDEAMAPLREFMFRQIDNEDLYLFAQYDNSDETYVSADDIPNRVVIPAFILGELKKGFIIGFLIYIPFLVIDMVVASILMAMGMMMLPPSLISLPFKIMFFVLSGGWNLVIESVIGSFR